MNLKHLMNLRILKNPMKHPNYLNYQMSLNYLNYLLNRKYLKNLKLKKYQKNQMNLGCHLIRMCHYLL
jgi:hypothetical protein